MKYLIMERISVMSIYQGQWPETTDPNKSNVRVMVDDHPLPAAEAEVPGVGQAFGWGTFSPFANRKLLAYSLLIYEMHEVMGLSRAAAHKYLIDIGDSFMEDMVAKLGAKWSLDSETIRQWFREHYQTIWDELTTGEHAHA
jgi:hypothetical protein